MDDLDNFFSTSAPEPQPEPDPEPAPEPVAQEPEAPPQTEDNEPPVPQPGERAVPLAALEAERARRRDYKTQAARFEEQAKAAEEARKALQAQFDEFKRTAAAPPPAPVQQAPQRVATPAPNPIEDPEGYVAYQQRTFQEGLLNERLNMSEQMLRQQHDDVDDVMKVFQAEVAKNPALGAQLAQQPHPYKWAYETAKRITAMQEIGPDPAAYRSKLEAELRAKWEAERAAPAPAPEAPKLPTSLAASRSAAPRGPVAPAGDAFDRMFASK